MVKKIFFLWYRKIRSICHCENCIVRLLPKAVFLIAVFGAHTVFALDIQSEVFKSKGYIPDRYTCDAQDFSPPLIWSDIPANTKSFVLICDDPDAPFKIWVHWVAFNIPPKVKEFGEGISKAELGKIGVIQGTNDFGKVGYKGPCPPPGKAHRYVFRLYALDTNLSLEEGVSKKNVVEAMQGHILSEAKLVGSYQRVGELQVQEEE